MVRDDHPYRGDRLKEKGLITNIFTFVDASQLVSKVSL